jgi:hypothetical protein
VLIIEYAQGLAQFRAGNVHSSNWLGAPNQTDMIQTRRTYKRRCGSDDLPHGPHKLTFGYAEGSPFRDERMRKALSMLIDREVEPTPLNVNQFRNIGLPMSVIPQPSRRATRLTGWTRR